MSNLQHGGICSCEVRFIRERWIIDDYGNALLNSVSGGVRRIVRLAAILNLAYFGIEFAVALTIGSVPLFADSIDFLEDTAVNLLILLALNRSVQYRARMGMVLSGAILVPGVATLWTAWHKFAVPVAPSP